MPEIQYRQANIMDVPAIARLRTGGWGTEEFWMPRVAGYMNGEIFPQHALAARILYLATDGVQPVGCIAGHLTKRHGCNGELQWIDVLPHYRRTGVATNLLRLLAAWFVQQNALRVCVDVSPENAVARGFYKRNGATDLNAYWLVWADIGVAAKGV